MAGNQTATTRTRDMSQDPGTIEVVHRSVAPAPTPPSPYAIGLRLAWWGRVSTEDQQDPTLSLPRQLHNSRSALPTGALIVAHYYDVESGRKDLALRGYSHAHKPPPFDQTPQTNRDWERMKRWDKQVGSAATQQSSSETR